jgi:hypothetical protein
MEYGSEAILKAIKKNPISTAFGVVSFVIIISLLFKRNYILTHTSNEIWTLVQVDIQS